MKKVISTTFSSVIAILLVFTFTNCITNAQEKEYEIKNFSTNLEVVWDIVWGPDNYLWVSERPGRVLRINPENGIKELVLDITSQVQTGGERGLMGMALSPDFNIDKFLFLSYTYSSNTGTTVKIVRYKYEGDELVEPFIIIDDIAGAGNHDGCSLEFGSDGKLYITTGDAAKPAFSQDLTSINGKVLRLNPDGSIPEDNPYFGSSSARNEIWSYGHRNQQGLVFNNDLLYSSEHGSNTNDELNLIEKNRNYGWPNVEGFCDKPNEMDYCKVNNTHEPMAVYNVNNTLAVASVDYYPASSNGKYFNPDWQNSIFMTTLKTGILMQIELSADGKEVINETNIIQTVYGRLRAVCVAPDGRIFVGTSNRDGRGSIRENDDKILVLEKLNTTTEIETNDNGLLINIYPNPSFGSLFMESASEKPSSVNVFDNLGNKIKGFELKPFGNVNIETNTLSSGRYNFQIMNNGSLTNKIINIIN